MDKPQINPPFDGSAPCPMCSQEIRGCTAYVHNMLNRWHEGTDLPEPKFWVKLDDLVLATKGEPGYCDPRFQSQQLKMIKTDHPDIRAHLDHILALVDEYMKHPRPKDMATAQTVFAAIKPHVEKLRETKKPVDLLGAAHFDDQRHACGQENYLREERGYSDDRGGHYHYTVKVVTGDVEEYDIRHVVCNTKLALHEHFKSRIAKDPKFYGHIWCPTCVRNLPADQFPAK